MYKNTVFVKLISEWYPITIAFFYLLEVSHYLDPVQIQAQKQEMVIIQGPS